MQKILWRLLFPGIALISFSAEAQQDSMALSLTGFVDAYYYYSFNDPVDNRIPYATQPVNHNEFNINHALIDLDFSHDRYRGTLALQVGTYPDVNYSAEPAEIAKLIYEASAGVRIFKNTWIDFGIMPGNLGYEPTLSIDREIYSSAFNTEYTPYYQMGVALSHRFNDQFDATFYVSNGWQNIYETNRDKALALSINYRVSDKLNLYYSNFFGNVGTDSDKKYLVYNHINAAYQVTDRLKVAASLDLGLQEEFSSEDEGSIFFGMIIVDYAITDHFAISGRYEYAIDDGLNIFIQNPALIGQPIRGCETTLNFKYLIKDQLVLRAEAKRVNSNEQIFPESDNGVTDFADGVYYIGFSLAVRFSKTWQF
jgi:hypothetical protein